MKKRIVKKIAKLVIGILLVGTMAACSGSGGVSGNGPTPPPPPPDNPLNPEITKHVKLTTVRVEDVKEQVKNYIDQEVDRQNKCVYRSRCGNGEMDVPCLAMPVAESGGPAEGGSSTESRPDFTDTNIQEQGVDEADLTKTDGQHLYVVASGKLRIFKVWPFSDFGLVSELPINGTVNSLYLAEGKVVVYSRELVNSEFRTIVTFINVADPKAPQVLRESFYNGSLLNSRRVKNIVHTVINSNIKIPEGVKYYIEDPSLIPSCDGFDEKAPESAELKAAKDALKKNNRALIDDVDISGSLVGVIRNNDGSLQISGSFIVNFMMSPANTGFSIVSMISTDLDDLNAKDNVISVVGNGNTLYASMNAIYVAQDINIWDVVSDLTNGNSEVTLIHRFQIGASTGTSYTGSGAVAGHLLTPPTGQSEISAQFAMSEHEGFLRIATTIGFNGSNNVFVLDANDPDMKLAGSITDLAAGESIHAVRFMGPRGFIVTFKKTDPLYTIDLKDPRAPKVAGELEMPGYSTYLHPFDDNALIGLGKDGDDMGGFAWYQGVKLSLLSVGDMANPKELKNMIIGTRGTHSEALEDHHAFTFDRTRGILALPITLYEEGSGGGDYGTFKYEALQLFRVGLENGFEKLGEIKVESNDSCGNNYYCDRETVRRTVIIGDGKNDGVIIVKDSGVALHQLDAAFTQMGSVGWDHVVDPYQWLLY